MTNEQIFEIADKYGDWDDFGRWTFRDNDGLLRFVDAVAKAEKQEPLVWMNKYGHVASFKNDEYTAPLYTAPVHAIDISQERVDETAKRKHEWVGLTEEELKTWKTVPIFEGVDPDQIRWIARKAEETLKEKNA